MAVIREVQAPLEAPEEVKPEENSFEAVEAKRAQLFHTKKEAWQTFGIKRHLNVFLFILGALISLAFVPFLGEVRDMQAVVVPANLIHLEALKYGKVSTLQAKEGERVEAGKVLAVIENPGDLLDIGETQNELKRLESELRTLDTKRIYTFERMRTDEELLKNRVIARDEFKSSELSFKTLEGEREALKARMSWLREKLRFLREEKGRGIVKAPVSGRVISDPESLEGSFVNKGEFLLTLAGGEERIEFLLPEVDYGRVRVGDRASVQFYAFPEKRFQGEVVRVKHYAEPVDKHGFRTAAVKVLIKLKETPEGIRNGMSAKVWIKARRVSVFEFLRRRI